MVPYPNDMDKSQSSLVQLTSQLHLTTVFSPTGTCSEASSYKGGQRPDTFQNHTSLLQTFHFSSLSYSGPSGSMERIYQTFQL